MVVLKFFRWLSGVAGIIAFIGGVIALFTANWSMLLGAVVVLLVALIVFACLHGPIQKSELFDIGQRHILIGRLTAEGRWQEALGQSSRSVSTLARYNPDRPGSGEQALSLPLAVARLTHGLLEAANGRIAMAQSTIAGAVSVLERQVRFRPEAEGLLQAGIAAVELLGDRSLPEQNKVALARGLLSDLSGT